MIEDEDDLAEKRAYRALPSVKRLFAMTNEDLLEEWWMAKLDELEARIVARHMKATTSEEREAVDRADDNERSTLHAELVRLVISFRLMKAEEK